VYTVTPLSLIYRNKGELSKINGLRKGGWGFELEGKREGVFLLHGAGGGGMDGGESDEIK
jgi:hypothetical protein